MAEPITLTNPFLTAEIQPKGAELISLIPAGGAELIWSGDPALWASQAPNLFPIVGALTDNQLIHEGRAYPMQQHGFLRRSELSVIEHGSSRAVFQLVDSPESWAQYPFAFVLTLTYVLENDHLAICFTLHNPAETPLYAGLGGHPGFRWPLSPGDGLRDQHCVVFAQPEPAPIRRLRGRTLDPCPFPTPVTGRVLRLDDRLFDSDALIFDALVSRSLCFGIPDGRGIRLDFPDFPHFGIWTKPGRSPFLCLEPWQSMASPDGFAGEFRDKPGLVRIEPGATRNWRYSIHPLNRMDAA